MSIVKDFLDSLLLQISELDVYAYLVKHPDTTFAEAFDLMAPDLENGTSLVATPYTRILYDWLTSLEEDEIQPPIATMMDSIFVSFSREYLRSRLCADPNITEVHIYEELSRVKFEEEISGTELMYLWIVHKMCCALKLDLLNV